MSWEGSFGTQERGRDMVWTKRIDTSRETRTWTIKLEDPTKKWVVSPARESKLKGLAGGIFQPYLTLNPCKTNWLECWRWLKDKERQGHVSSCRTLSNVDSPTNIYHYLYQIFRFAVCLFSLFCLDVVSNCLGGDSSCSAWGKPSDSSKSFMSLARAHDSDIPDNTWQYQFQFSHIHSLVSPNSLATGLEVFKIRFDLFLIVGFFRMNTKAYQNSPTETFPYKSVTGTTRTHQRRALRNHRSPPCHSHSQRRPRVVARVARERILPSPWSLSPSLAKLQDPSSATPAFQTSIFPNSFFKFHCDPNSKVL